MVNFNRCRDRVIVRASGNRGVVSDAEDGVDAIKGTKEAMCLTLGLVLWLEFQ